MQKWQKRYVRQAGVLSFLALGAISCADLLELERGTLRVDADDAAGGAKGFDGGPSREGGDDANAMDSSLRDGAGGAKVDGSVDGAAGNGGSGGASGTGGMAGSGGAAGSGGTKMDGGTGGAAGSGGAAGTGGGGTGGGGTGGGAGSGGGGAGGSAGIGGTGGSAGIGGTGGATGGTGGAGGPDAAGGSGGSGGTSVPDAGPTCTTGQKLCNGSCVATNDPATHCADTACTPCSFPNATAVCNASGQCALGPCKTGFDDCKKTDPTDGCETDLSKPETCGSCTAVCSTALPLCSGSNGSYQCVSGCTAPTSRCGTQCVDTNTNAAYCGSCTNACKAPTNGQVSCSGGMCQTSCNTNYHACVANTVTTCASDNSPATCGTSCSPCSSTDPNANPANATCVNKACVIPCKTGYNSCGGVCSDTNALATCGPSCLSCTKPANASAVSCNGTACVVTCNPGYEVSGTSCVVATNLYVSTSGLDTNTGTQASPFRTWKRAASFAQSGTTVNFVAGNYDTLGGDDFTDAIPNGVILQRAGSGTVTFTADGQHSLVFAGTGTVQNIALTHFRSPLSATTGKQTVTGVTITQQVDAIHVSGGAVMVISGTSSISGGPTENPYLVQVDSTATLTMLDSTINGTWTNCFAAETGGGILATGSSTLSLGNVTCSGGLSPCVIGRVSAKIGLTSSSLLALCQGLITADNTSANATNTSFTGMEARDASTWTMSGSTVTDSGFGVGLNGTGKITFRNSYFAGINGVGIGGAGTYDFGTASVAGNNHFNTASRDHGGLNVNLDGVTVQAHGNYWVPGQQGADGSTGVMPSKYLVGPVDGYNIYIVSDQSAVDM